MVDLPTFNASVKEFRSLVKENVEQNKDKKKVDAQQSELMRKTLGISERRFASQQKAAEEAKASREALNDLKRQLEEQGVDVKKAKNFQKLEAEVVKKERAARLKAMPRASALKEQAKEGATYLRNILGKYLGPGSRIGGLLGSIAGNLKSKVTGAISSLFGLLKTGSLVAGLAALLLFLDSQLWKDLKKDLIPKLEAGLIRLKASIDRIIDDFIGPDGSFLKGTKSLFAEIFGEDGKTSKSINRVLDSFFGPQGSLKNGINTLLKELFGTNIEEVQSTTWYKGLSLAFTGIVNAIKFVGDGIYDIYTLWVGGDGLVDKNNKPIGRLQYLYENFGEIASVIGTLAFLLAPRLMFKGLTAIAFFGLTKLNGAFDNLAKRLKKAAGFVDDIDVPGAGKAMTVTKAASATAASFRGQEAGRLQGQARYQAGTVIKGVKVGGRFKATAEQTANILEKFPRFAKVLEYAGPIGKVLSVGILSKILYDVATGATPIQEAIPQIAGLTGGIGGAVLGTFLGGALGLAGGPVALLTAIAGGLFGAFGGEMIATAFAQYLLNQPINAFPKFTGLDNLMNGMMSQETFDSSALTSSMGGSVSNTTIGNGGGGGVSSLMSQSSYLDTNVTPLSEAFTVSGFNRAGGMNEGQVLMINKSDKNDFSTYTTTSTAIQERDSILTAHLASGNL